MESKMAEETKSKKRSKKEIEGQITNVHSRMDRLKEQETSLKEELEQS